MRVALPHNGIMVWMDSEECLYAETQVTLRPLFVCGCWTTKCACAQDMMDRTHCRDFNICIYICSPSPPDGVGGALMPSSGSPTNGDLEMRVRCISNAHITRYIRTNQFRILISLSLCARIQYVKRTSPLGLT